MTNNVFKEVSIEKAYMVALYSFIPLNSIKCKYEDAFVKLKETEPSDFIKDTKARYIKVELVDGNSLSKSNEEILLDNVEMPQFYFGYKYKQVCYNRSVKLRFWVVKFRSSLNQEGRFYLVVSTCIDKAFSYNSLVQNDICSLQDILQLKKSFYKELYCLNEKKEHISILSKLDEIILEVTGEKSNRKYGLHCVMDVYGVGIDSKETIDSYKTLDCCFSKAYYSNNSENVNSYDEVFIDYDKLVYGLIYGNENSDVLPSDIKQSLLGGFSNNKSERLFAGHQTIVYLHTHYPFQWEPINESKTISLDSHIDSINGNFLLYDICLVMEAKFKLNSIQESLKEEHPSGIKEALSSISGYLKENPYHIGEFGRRYKYLYQAMGVTDLLETVISQGSLLSSAKEIELNERLSHRVNVLTGFTVIIGILSLVVSILSYKDPIVAAFVVSAVVLSLWPLITYIQIGLRKRKRVK